MKNKQIPKTDTRSFRTSEKKSATKERLLKQQLLLEIVLNSAGFSSGLVEASTSVHKRLCTYFDNHGAESTIKYVKRIRIALSKYLAGENVMLIDRVSRTKEGIPKILSHLIPGIRLHEPNAIRAAYSALQISYCIKDRPLPDLSSITLAKTVDSAPIERNIANFFEHVLLTCYKSPEAKIFKRPVTAWTEPHITMKAGPNGKAMSTCDRDLVSLKDNPHLVEKLKRLGGPTYAAWLDQWIHDPYQLTRINTFLSKANEALQQREHSTRSKSRVHVAPSNGHKKVDRPYRLRKLSIIDSPEGKARPIGISDYFTQSALKPLHDWAFAILREIREDCTYNQSKSLHSSFEHYYSFDLTAATDRFPVSLQERIISVLLGSDVGEAWRYALTSTPFSVDFPNKQRINSAVYEVGQPMGAYSSWGVFSLCHHIVVQYCYWICTLEPLWFHDYMLLGDDIVIGNSRVAEVYRGVMTDLGVEINSTKTLVSGDTFEFAKRIIHRGTEVTALPLQAIHETITKPVGLWSSMLTLVERGYISYDACPPLCLAVHDEFKKRTVKRPKLLSRFHRDAIKFIHILHYYRSNRGTVLQTEMVTHAMFLNRMFNTPFGCNGARGRQIQELMKWIVLVMQDYAGQVIVGKHKEVNRLMDLTISHSALNAERQPVAGNGPAVPIDMKTAPLIHASHAALRDSREILSDLHKFDGAEWPDIFSHIDLLFAVSMRDSGSPLRLLSLQPNLNKLAHSMSLVDHLRKSVARSLEERENVLAE